MPTPQKRRGLFSRTVTRLIHAPLLTAAGLTLLLALLIWPQAALALSRADVESMDADRASDLFGDVPRDRYFILPSDSIANPDSVKAKDTGMIVCFQAASRCDRSAPNRGEGLEFRLTKLHHFDNGGGGDSWDFVYSPVINGKAVNTQLAFIYRSNTGKAGLDPPDSWGLVVGDPGSSTEVEENRVGTLESFGDSDLADKVLDSHANDDKGGVEWAKAGGAEYSEQQSEFAERALQDPFMQAVAKATEAINSLIAAVSGALLWAVQTSNPNEVKGLGEAWKTVRDLVNVLFILILATIAIMTIMRIDVQKYSVRSLLPMLIFAIIAVNFSFVIATVLVNTAYVLSQPFLEGAKEIIETAGALGSGYGGSATDFGTAIVMLLAAILLLVALAILLFFFVIRIIVIWLLSALSPVVCLFMVLPLTRGESKKIMENGIKWIYMAPISLLILYIGSRVAFPNPGQDEVVDGFLSALFYGGLIIAAVIIPIGLGGRVMSMAASRGSSAAKLGGKGGLGLAGSIPLGRGMSVGEAARTGKALLKTRKTAQEDRANERAVTLATQGYEALGPGLGGAVFGLDDSRRQQYRNALVEKEQKSQTLDGLGADGAYRVVQHRTGQLGAGELSREELAVANDPIGELAAWKTVVESNFAEPEHMGRYARHGLHRQSKDPLIASVQKSYRGGDLAPHIDRETLQYGLSFGDAEGYKDMPGSFWSRPLDADFARQQPQAAALLRSNIHEHVNPGGIQKFFDNTDRARGARVKRERAGQAYDLMSEINQRAMRQANYQSFRDGGQHVALGRHSTEALARHYETLGNQVRDPGNP